MGSWKPSFFHGLLGSKGYAIHFMAELFDVFEGGGAAPSALLGSTTSLRSNAKCHGDTWAKCLRTKGSSSTGVFQIWLEGFFLLGGGGGETVVFPMFSPSLPGKVFQRITKTAGKMHKTAGQSLIKDVLRPFWKAVFVGCPPKKVRNVHNMSHSISSDHKFERKTDLSDMVFVWFLCFDQVQQCC